MEADFTPKIVVEKYIAEILPQEILRFPQRMSTETANQYLSRHFIDVSERVCTLAALQTNKFVNPGYVRTLTGSAFRAIFGIKVCQNAGIRF